MVKKREYGTSFVRVCRKVVKEILQSYTLEKTILWARQPHPPAIAAHSPQITRADRKETASLA